MRGRLGTSPRGVTLVELLVVLALLGLLGGVAGLVVGRSEARTELGRRAEEVAIARRAAIREGRQVTIELLLDDGLHAVTAFPDGAVVTDAAVRAWLGIDRLSGEVAAGTVETHGGVR